MDIRIARYIPATRAEGPGLRACIQVQGCPIRCAGCAVPDTWAPNKGRLTRTEEIVRQLAEAPALEGITFLGGEPFAQAKALAEIGQAAQRLGLSVLTFTGYLREDLEQAGRREYDDLLAVTDLLIDGPFQQEHVDFSRPWAGSSNQRFHFLTDRYMHLAAKLHTIPNRLEIRISADGRFLINGLAPLDEIKALIRDRESPG